MHDLTYPTLALATTAYALFLESKRRNPHSTYAPRWTWLTVVVGCSVVGAFATLRVWLEGPDALARWACVVWFLHFVAGGLPIIIWQEVVDRRNLKDALDLALARRRED